ncbi:MAG: VWA domain-containing protein, partial [Anaerolineae bacterium]
GSGDQLDLRHLFRENMRYAGELIDLPTRVPTFKPRPLVMICDISGSMERYTRLLLHFVHTLSQSIYQVESFVFSTRLSRITRIIRRKAVDRALAEVGITVKDWGGGTKIGEALHTFNYQWARRVLGRGAVVLLITDGWDRGDPDVLRNEIERLQRNCHRLIWLNPLLGSPDYEPLTRGAQAMLPYADDFLPVHNLASLENLAKELWQVNWHRPTRVRHGHLINSK